MKFEYENYFNLTKKYINNRVAINFVEESKEDDVNNLDPDDILRNGNYTCSKVSFYIAFEVYYLFCHHCFNYFKLAMKMQKLVLLW